LAEESLKLFREIGHRWGICETLTWLAMALINQEDHQQARNHLEESLALARKARDGNEISFAVWQLGRTAMLQGNYAQAITLLEEALAVNRELKLSGGAAFVLSDLGKAILLKGDYQQAISCYKEMLAIYWKFGDERSIASSLEQLASVAVAQTHPEQAARLFGAAEVLRDARGAARYPFQIADYERNLESLRLQLDEATFAAQWAAGRAMTLEQAIAYALEEKA
jgi:tetratricopeptide (TPR) repeat protein